MIDVHQSMDRNTRQSILQFANCTSYVGKKNSKVFNVTKSLIKLKRKVLGDWWVGGGEEGGAIWRIVRTSETILAKPLVFMIMLCLTKRPIVANSTTEV